jgi:hypothetical protein
VSATLKLLSSVVIAGFTQIATPADQRDLSCLVTEDPDDWIESIRISPSQSRVWIKFKRNDDTIEVPLLYVSQNIATEPIYAFNRPVAGSDDHVVNAFKVFRVGKQWLQTLDANTILSADSTNARFHEDSIHACSPGFG